MSDRRCFICERDECECGNRRDPRIDGPISDMADDLGSVGNPSSGLSLAMPIGIAILAAIVFACFRG